MPATWRIGFRFAWQLPDREPDEGPGLTWRQLTPRHWSGTWNTKIRGTVTLDSEGWLAYVRLEDPPGLSPITTVGRFATVEEAQVATDEVWAARVIPPANDPEAVRLVAVRCRRGGVAAVPLVHGLAIS